MGNAIGSQPSGLMGRFNNLSVKAKIFGGFGAVLVILIVLGGASFFGLSTVSTEVVEYRRMTDVGFTAADVYRKVLMMRRYTRELAITGSADAAKLAKEAAADLGKRLESAKAIIVVGERKAALENIVNNFDKYVAAIDELATLQATHQGELRGVIDQAGRTMRTALLAFREAAAKSGQGAAVAAADETMTAAVRSRLGFYRFFMTGEADSLEDIEARQDEVVAGLKKMNAVRGGALGEPYEKALAAVETYIQAKDKAFADRKSIEFVVEKKAVPVGAEILNKVEFLQKNADEKVEEVESEMLSQLSMMTWLIAVLSAVAVVIGAGLAWIIGSGIAKGIIEITGAMRELASGNKAIDVPHRARKDEVGAMAAALQVFKETAIEADRMAGEQKAEQEKRMQRAEYISKLVSDFNDAIKTVVDSVSSGASQLKTNAQALSAIAEETNNQSTTVAAAAEEASRSVQTVASAADELNSSISEINRQIDGSAKLAGSAVSQVKATNETVETLSAAAQEIGNVVQLIQDIAAQTNLLALNATIEAARAGEAGKGFAVVASEVKTLANQTAKATEDISAQIARIQTVANQSVEAMAEVGKSVGQISEASTTVAAAAQEQAAATAEISRSVQQVSAGTGEVASNITHVTKAAGETGEMATQVLDASNDLTKQSEQLRSVVGQFIERVKAA